MGFFQNLLGVTPDDSVNKVDAAVAPYNYQQYAQPFDYFGLSSISRAQAMQVPAVARARNIICATIGSLPLEVRRESNNSKVSTPPFIRQPDPRMNGSSVYTFLAEDLLFTGQGYLRILELGTDGRPLSAEWISTSRVTRTLDAEGFNVRYYSVDGTVVPQNGLGSLIPFTGYDEGLLVRAMSMPSDYGTVAKAYISQDLYKSPSQTVSQNTRTLKLKNKLSYSMKI